jgi:hypothetical protein
MSYIFPCWPAAFMLLCISTSAVCRLMAIFFTLNAYNPYRFSNTQGEAKTKNKKTEEQKEMLISLQLHMLHSIVTTDANR